MNNNDYIVLFDENGQPYIEHAFGDNARAAWGKLKGTSTKYLEKIPDYYGKGKSLYLYTKDQVNAFHNQTKAKVKDALGYDERGRRDAAQRSLDRASQHAENAHKGLVNAMNNRPVLHRTKDDERVIDNWTKLRGDAWRAEDNRREDLRKAQTDFDKTVLGKIEKASKTLSRAKDIISDYGETTLDQIHNASTKAGEAGRNALSSLLDKIRNDPPKPKLSDPNEKIITENIIPEKTITENTIPEKNITENVIPEKTITETKQSNRDRFLAMQPQRHKYTASSSDEYLEASASNMNVPSLREYMAAKEDLFYAKANYENMVKDNAAPDTVAEYKRYLDDAQRVYISNRQQLIIDLNRISESD